MFVAITATALLASALTTTEAAAADPAPTNVHVSWKDDTFQQVRVTWEEDAPRPNKIVLRHRGTTAGYLPVYLPAGAPNVVDIAAWNVPYYAWVDSAKPLEFAVSVGTQTGETSPSAVSEAFDALTPYPPTRVSASMSGTSTIHVTWAPANVPDETPNDPLDRNIPLTYAPYYTTNGPRVPIGKQGPATQLTFTGPKPPFTVGVVAHNEWGGQFPSTLVNARLTQLTVKIPTWSVYGLNTSKITGTFSTTAGEPRLVVLQARNSSTSPWYVVRSYAFRGGKFEFTLGTAGTRQYRVAIPNAMQYGSVAWFGAYSAAATSTTRLRTLGYFWYTAIYAGWTNQARLRVEPGVNTTAILQRWNGKTWTTVGSVKVTNGYGVGYIRTTTRGRVAYRYYVPASTYGGLRFAAAYTPTFVNVVV